MTRGFKWRMNRDIVVVVNARRHNGKDAEKIFKRLCNGHYDPKKFKYEGRKDFVQLEEVIE